MLRPAQRLLVVSTTLSRRTAEQRVLLHVMFARWDKLLMRCGVDCQYASLGAKPLQRAFSLVLLLLRCCYILSFRSDCQLVYATVRVH